jgi:hypothetical protein
MDTTKRNGSRRLKTLLMGIFVVFVVAAVGAAVVITTRGPSWRPVVEAPSATPEVEPARALVGGGSGRSLELAEAIDVGALPTTEWVGVHDPTRASRGYLLAFFDRRVPMILDLSGRVVHAWPEVRAVSRASLNPDCSLTFIDVNNNLQEVSWTGESVRSFSTGDPTTFAHHDFQRLDDGGMVAILRDTSVHTDNIAFVDPGSSVTHLWRSSEHLQDDFLDEPFQARDLTHFNSVQVLPENPWFTAGDARFRPGNVLVSARHLNLIFIFDRASGEVVWRYTTELDWQHEAHMIGPGLPGAGDLLFFNNRAHAPERRSEVVEVDPRDGRVVWTYRSERFFSDVAGLAQKLENGNVQVVSSRGGRAFEVDPATNDIVWQWNPPHIVMRPRRYALDYCPQLAALERLEQLPVSTSGGLSFVDKALYQFSVSKDHKSAWVGERRRKLLPDGSACGIVRLPYEPLLSIEYGFVESERVPSSAMSGQVRVTIKEQTSELEPEVLFQEDVSLEQSGAWSRDRLRVDDHWGGREVELCVLSNAPVIPENVKRPKGFVVGEPRISSMTDQKRQGLPRVRGGSQRTTRRGSDGERELRLRQLEELGYIE